MSNMLGGILRWGFALGCLLVAISTIWSLREANLVLQAEVDGLQIIIKDEHDRYERINQALVRLGERGEARAQSATAYQENLSKARKTVPDGDAVLDVVVPGYFLNGLRAYAPAGHSVSDGPSGAAQSDYPPDVAAK